MKQRGYTLIELLLYVTIVSGLLLAVSVFFGASVEARIKNQSIAEVDQQGMAAMEYMSQTIRNADSITSPTLGTSGASLTLAVPTGTLSPTVFNLDGTALQLQEGTGAAIALTSSKVQISSLIFRNLSRASTPGMIQISFIASRTNTSGRNEYDYQKTFTTTVALRW